MGIQKQKHLRTSHPFPQEIKEGSDFLKWEDNRRHTSFFSNFTVHARQEQILISVANGSHQFSEFPLLSQEFKGHFTNRAAVVTDYRPLSYWADWQLALLSGFDITLGPRDPWGILRTGSSSWVWPVGKAATQPWAYSKLRFSLMLCLHHLEILNFF